MQPIKIPQFMPNGKWQVDGILGADFWYGICHSVVSDYCLVYGAERNLRPPEFQRLPSPGIAERAKGSGRQNIYIVHSREPADNPNEEPIEREMDCLWMKVAGKEGLFHIDLNLDGSYLYDDFFERVPKSARLRFGAHRFSYLPPISTAPSHERPEVLEWVATRFSPATGSTSAWATASSHSTTSATIRAMAYTSSSTRRKSQQ